VTAGASAPLCTLADARRVARLGVTVMLLCAVI
jgi:hypothetical protein